VSTLELQYRLHKTGLTDIEWSAAVSNDANTSILQTVILPDAPHLADAERPTWLTVTVVRWVGDRTITLDRSSEVVHGTAPEERFLEVAGVRVRDTPGALVRLDQPEEAGVDSTVAGGDL
jgi:hypothetical protein